MMNPAENSWILTGCCKWHISDGGCRYDKCCLDCPSWDAKKFALEKGITVQQRYVGEPLYQKLKEKLLNGNAKSS